MQNNQENPSHSSSYQGDDAENHQIGRDLFNRDQQRHNTRPAWQQGQDAHWDAGNHFHTGYSHQTRSHFPEDSHQRTTNADRGGSLQKQHYGDRDYSSYRNPSSLNYGAPGSQVHEYGSSRGSNAHFAPYGDSRGNYSARQDSYGQGHDNIHADTNFNERRRQDDSNENYYRGAYMDTRGVQTERPLPERNPYNEWPGSRSRFKDDDYRYGSGNHGWYQEHRYTANDGRAMDPDRGGILGEMGEGLREAWHDVSHGVSNLWHRNASPPRRHEDHHPHQSQHGGHHKYEYRSQADRGIERGPRWSDENDNRDDSFFYGSGNKPRYY